MAWRIRWAKLHLSAQIESSAVQGAHQLQAALVLGETPATYFIDDVSARASSLSRARSLSFVPNMHPSL